jgi:hypothetical protein
MNGPAVFALIPALAGFAQALADKDAISPRALSLGWACDVLEGNSRESGIPKSLTASRALARPPIGSVPVRSCAERGAAPGHRHTNSAAVQLDLFCSASHSMEPGAGRGWVGCGLPRCSACSCSYLRRVSS